MRITGGFRNVAVHQYQDLSMPVLRAIHPYYQQCFDWKPEYWPNAARLGQHTVSLPLSPKLTDEDVQRVTEAAHAIVPHRPFPVYATLDAPGEPQMRTAMPPKAICSRAGRAADHQQAPSTFA
jgi:hypothetical protein